MSVASPAFLVAVFPVILLLVIAARGLRGGGAAELILILVSVAFYATGNAAHLPLLLGSILGNWYAARRIAGSDSAESRRRALVLAIGANIILLAFFKYAHLLPLPADVPAALRAPAFPLGLSFFTLTQVMFLVDVYEQLITPPPLRSFAAFVSFFPTITAGPLLRYRRFSAELPKLAGATDIGSRIAQGGLLIAIGLFKKVVIADSAAIVANRGYASLDALGTLEAWLTGAAYTMQMYFDFSGYSDIAFGLAFILGIEIVQNFDVPFRSSNLSAFWQRWHISLSSFITTYLYTPILKRLGRPSIRTSAVATFIAMTIAGLWHGATMPFVLFYVLHGTGLAVYQYWKRSKRKMPEYPAVALTLLFCILTFAVSRAPGLDGVGTILSAMLVPKGGAPGFDLLGGINPIDLQYIALPCLAAPVLALAGPTSWSLAQRARPGIPTALAAGAVASVSALFLITGVASSFIYQTF
jgi:D-alanyl-lipoteichoic acid acyltransferase DltB (MBOAT superfamily)